MTKQEAVEKFVNDRLNSIPQDWVRIVMDDKNDQHALPMWGTMWFIDSIWGEKLMAEAVEMEDYDQADPDKKHVNEEMMGEKCVQDKDGEDTNLYIYEVDGEYLIGVHGAGFDFYDGVWDKLYDVLGLRWHD